MRDAGPRDPFDHVRFWQTQRSEKGWWHSFELPDGSRIEGVCGLESLRNRIAQYPIPADLRGKRVLDIGTWDGFFAFEMEKRGADVMAVDNWDNPRFREMHARLGSRVDYRQFDIYDLTPARIGRFDIVLFMGVLYHLKHPLLALERVCALTTEMAAVDSFILREEHLHNARLAKRPILEFFETNQFGGQTDNWNAPTLACLLALCRTAGFARAEFRNTLEHCACVACYRKWAPPREGIDSAAELVEVWHDRNFGINFDSAHDEYVSAAILAGGRNLTLDEVKPEVSGFGVRPIHVALTRDQRWEAKFKLPPGLAPGWHGVAVRIGDGPPGNEKPIAVDIPLQPGPIRITGVCDGTTWAADQLNLARGNSVAIWVAGLPENADRNNVRVYLDGRRLRVDFVETRRGTESRQVNAEVPLEAERGLARLGVALGDSRSEAAKLTLLAG